MTLVHVAFLPKCHTARNFQQQSYVDGRDRIDYEVLAAIGILTESTIIMENRDKNYGSVTNNVMELCIE